MTDAALPMPSPGRPYSQWCRRGDVAAIAGQTGANVSGVLAQTAEEQTERALRNLQTALRAAGGNLRDVVAVRVYLASLGDFELLNDACAGSSVSPALPGPRSAPCCPGGCSLRLMRWPSYPGLGRRRHERPGPRQRRRSSSKGKRLG